MHFLNENNCGKYGLCKTLEEAADEQTEIFITNNHYKEDAKNKKLQKKDKIYRKENTKKKVLKKKVLKKKVLEKKVLKKKVLKKVFVEQTFIELMKTDY